MEKPIGVAILIFPEVEVLDFAGPFEVFSVATRVCGRDRDLPFAPFEPALISRDGGMVHARHGLRVTAHKALADAISPDVIIVPGGVMTNVMADFAVREWIEQAHHTAAVTASVCTGAFLLAKAGLLDGLAATTHWEDMDELARMAPHTELRRHVTWVDQGRIITSGGISAGIDMSLHIVARLSSMSLAHRTARQMEYRWPY
jgi:transcriptional regulator GlxA family with amidase domain